MAENIDKTVKAEKFIKLANIRVQNAVKHLKLVQNLANSYNYDYDEQQARKIMAAIKFEYDALVSEFKKGLSRDKGGFKLWIIEIFLWMNTDYIQFYLEL